MGTKEAHKKPSSPGGFSPQREGVFGPSIRLGVATVVAVMVQYGSGDTEYTHTHPARREIREQND